MLNPKVMEKLTSGRFLFTLAAILVFTVLSIQKVLPLDKVQEVILIVIYAYFTRNRSEEKNGGPK
ncbi:MAG: hypothetical protein FJW63_01845 [Actinobacteria bacterium]|nr:hypothetical protein [Actinomycetota bacterium]